ncbi:MAG: hypothetical protein AB7Q17_05730 [Phycisphaerae bacterium]
MSRVIGGITDTLAAGDITLAARILWLALKLAWQEGVAALSRAWLEAKRFFIGTAQIMWFSALAAAQHITLGWRRRSRPRTPIVARIETTAAGLSTTYTYDVDGPEDGDDQTHNNYDPNYAEGEKPTRTVSDVYYANAHCSNIIIRDAEDLDAKNQQIARGLALYYASNGMPWRAVWETGSDDGGGGYDEHVKTAAVEFRYDSLRGRYLRRAVDPNGNYVPIETGIWTDYTGGGTGDTGVPHGSMHVSRWCSTTIRERISGLEGSRADAHSRRSTHAPQLH